MTIPTNTLRELTAGELDNVGGGAAPGQGHDPVPPPGTPPQPINPGAIISTEVSAVAVVPAAIPGLL